MAGNPDTRPGNSLDWERLIETAFTVGILPQQFWDMELWEFNCCVKAHNRKKKDAAKEAVAVSWETARFSSAAFASVVGPQYQLTLCCMAKSCALKGPLLRSCSRMCGRTPAMSSELTSAVP